MNKYEYRNSWWNDPLLINSDPKLQVFDNCPHPWHPTQLNLISNEDNIYCITGPRQVGKSTFLKLYIRDLLLNKNVPGKNILYLACDIVDSFQELVDILIKYLATNPAGRRYICLDEVSFVPEWQRAVKFLADEGQLRQVTCLITGSNAQEIKNAKEQMPGRRGTSRHLDIDLLPLSFREYSQIIDPVIMESLVSPLISSLFTKPGLPINIQPNILEKLRSRFDQYLLTGGFISVINALETEKQIGIHFYQTYLQWIRGDLVKLKKQERFARQIISGTLDRLASDLSWNSLTKNSDIGSHNTVIEYVEMLANGYVLVPLYQIDLNTRQPIFRKNKKLYLQDPFILHTLRWWLEGYPDPFEAAKLFLDDPENKSQLVENVAVTHLMNQAGRDNTFFWKGDYEIDLILKISGELFPMEIKYRNQIQHLRHNPINNRPIVTLSKNTLDPQNNTYPVYLILAML